MKSGPIVLSTLLLLFSISFSARAAVSFSSEMILSTNGNGAYAVSSADVDRDGDTDLLWTSYLDDKIGWFENLSGDWISWATNIISTSQNNPRSVIPADIDRDGDMDIFVASVDDDTIAWYANTNGAGAFGSQQTIDTLTLSGNPRIFAADIDGDGDTDLLSANAGENTVTWYENTNGLGAFAPAQLIANNAQNALGIFAADIDNDGDLDVLSASAVDDKIAWYENTGGTNWPETAISTTANQAVDVFAADLDRDGDTDVLSASQADYKIAWYENTGGTNWPETVISTNGGSPVAVIAVDLDWDGDLDVVAGTWQDKVISWFENTDGAAAFGGKQVISTNAQPSQVLGADMDGDADFEVVFTSSDSDQVGWFRNEMAHRPITFVQGHQVSTNVSNARSVYATDLDHDGDMDVLSASDSDDRVSWYDNDGNQNFTTRTISIDANQAFCVYAEDMDRDGDMDVLSASSGDNKIAWYDNDGSQNFSTNVLNASLPFSVYATDLDRDGDMDILSASQGDNEIAWYENDGNQNFTTNVISTNANTAKSVYAIDMDRDGDVDVLSASASDNKIAWYENDGNQNFTAHVISTNANAAWSVYAADVDSDGDMDVLSASYTDHKIAWYENDGNQNFTPHIISTDAINAKSVYAADMDSDGDMDVLSASASDDKIAWYKNDGSQNFTAHIISTNANGADSVYAADVDGDGDMDALAACAAEIVWYENAPSSDLYWDAGAAPSNHWSLAANWTGDTEPGLINTAYIGHPSNTVSAVADITQSASCANLFVGFDAGSTGIVSLTSDLTLAEGGALHVRNGSFTQQAGNTELAPSSSGSIHVGDAVNCTGTYTLNGGWIMAYATLEVGVNEGRGEFYQNGGTNSPVDLIIGQSATGGLYQITGGALNANELYLGMGSTSNGTLRIGSNAAVNVANVSRVGSGGGHGTLRLEGGSISGSNLVIRPNTGSLSIVDGWGSVNHSVNLIQNGIVRADGNGVDRSLVLTNYTALQQSLANGLAQTNGWYAVNRGKLVLKDIPYSGTGLYRWADPDGLDLVNAVVMNLTGVPAAGTISGTLLAPDHSDVPEYDPAASKVVSVCHFSNTIFTLTDADLQIRYDHARAAALAIAESNLEVYQHKNGSWQQITDYSVNVGQRRIVMNNLTSFGYLAVGLGIQSPTRVVSTVPAANAQNVSNSTSVTAVFSQDMDPATIHSTNLFLYSEMSGSYRSAPTYDGTNFSATVTPASAFKPGEVVFANAAQGIQSQLTNALLPYIWQFRTLVQSGSASFGMLGSPLGSGSSSAAVLSDLNGDGYLDGFVGNYEAGNRVYTNDGRGTLLDSGQSLGSYRTCAIALGDLTGDGNPDAFEANYGQGNRIYTNNGSGIFTDTGQTLGADASWGVALGDVNGDGYLDAFVANYNSANRVYTNDGSGTFVDSGQALGSNASWGVALGDLNGDGLLDAFVANYGQGNRVYTNSGSGVFVDTGQSIGTGNSHGVALGDVNGDLALDAIVANYGQANRVYTNNGAAAFTDTGQTLGLSTSHGVALGDLNADGTLDAFFANDSGGCKVYTNSGNGTLIDTGQSLGSSPGQAVSLGDLSGDGTLDAFVANGSGQGNTVWLNITAPSAPVVLSATNEYSTGFFANWQGVAGATNYFLDVSSTTGFSIYVGGYSNRSVGAMTTAEVTNALASSIYYYRLRAQNSIATSTNSSVMTANTPGAGAIGIIPTMLSYTSAPAGNPPDQTFVVTNAGASSFTYTNIVTYGAGASGWFTPTAACGTLASHTSQAHTGSVIAAGLPLGMFFATNTFYSAGATNSPVILTVTLSNNLELCELIVNSAQGGASPPSGTNFLAPGTNSICFVTNSPLVNGTTQYICTGWTGTGSVPPSGSTTNTGFYNLTNNSSIIWLWQTNYWLQADTGANGINNATNGWKESGSNVLILATPATGYTFSAWTGNVPYANRSDNPLTLMMDQARSITSTFSMATSPIHYVSTNGIHQWPYTNWTYAATNVQAAVDAAGVGDVVLVTNGVYSLGGRAVYGSMTNRVCVTNGVTVRSVNGAAVTFIVGSSPAGNGAVRGAYLAADATMAGFTITNGSTRTSGDTSREQSGGALWCDAGAVVSNCILVGNAANVAGGGAYGGVLRGCLILKNSASDGGGTRASTVQGCTIVSNTAQNGGGCYGGTIQDSIVYYNTATVSSNNYYGGNLQYSCTLPDPGAAGCITNAPAFRRASSGDYRLSAGSACLNAGINLDWMFEAYDLDGTPRIVNDLVDIGAYETLFRLDVGIILQGPYRTATDDMSLSLNTGGHIPLTSPYADDVRTVSAIPAAATDWVLVELRSTNSTLLSVDSVFLGQEGHLLTDDGRTGMIANVAFETPVHIAVKHRNHLSVMSAGTVAFSNTVAAYNFTTSSVCYLGTTNAAVEVEPGVWAQAAGDGDGDGQILPVDATIHGTQVGGTGYRRGDFDLNGSVTAGDVSLHAGNLGRFTAITNAETVLSPALTIAPAQDTTLPGSNIIYTAAGGVGQVNWAFVTNHSAATLTTQSTVAVIYTAGTATAGVDRLEAWDSEDRLGRSSATVLNPADVFAAGKAIVIAGRGGADDPLWPTTDYLAGYTYNTFLYRGYSRGNVQYLSPEPGRDVDGNGNTSDDIDLAATLTNVENTFTNWAMDAERLVVYLIDHGGHSGGNGYFRLNETQTVTAAQIDTWLDSYQTKQHKDVIVVIDCCSAGSFTNELAYPGPEQRIVIAACAQDEATYFLAGGLVSFTDSFLAGVLLGKDVADSFERARSAMSSYQAAQMTGDGTGVLIGPTYIGAQDRPFIGRVIGNQLLDRTATATLWADDIVSGQGISRVWCIVMPPGYNPEATNPVLELVELDLTYDTTDGRYEGRFDGFGVVGTYTVLFYASDDMDRVSDPRQTLVLQTDYDERAILLAGGPTSDANWLAISNMANQAYHTFRSRWIGHGSIQYLNPCPNVDVDNDGTPDRDADATLAELQSAITNWAASADKLTIYLIGGNSATNLRVNGSESLSAHQLDGWIDAFQASNTEAYVFLEFPGSGGFLPSLLPPDNRRRITVASTSEGSACASGNDGIVSFTQYFMAGIFRGQTIGYSFVKAGKAIRRATGTLRQRALLDDTGDGVSGKTDRSFARTRYIGIPFLNKSDVAMIGAATPSTTLSTTSSLTLWASNVTSVSGISNVWCTITTPDYDGTGDLPTTNLTWHSEHSRFETIYTNFSQPGTHFVTFYASDTSGDHSDPLQTEVVRRDMYEADNTSPLANCHNGSAQIHNFHDSNDVDWVWFYAHTNFIYEIETYHFGTNIDTVLDVYRQDSGGSLTFVDNVDDYGRDEGELASLQFPVSGFYYVKVSQPPSDNWLPGTYELSVEVPAGTPESSVLVALGVDRLAEGALPAGTEATLDTEQQVFSYDPNAAGVATFLRTEDGSYLMGITNAPASYKHTGDYPSQYTLTLPSQDPLVGLFVMMPYATIDGTVLDQWTGNPVEGATISFEGAGGKFDGVVLGSYPNTPDQSDWTTRADGTFPTNVFVPVTNWHLRISMPDYVEIFDQNALTDLKDGDTFDLGTLSLLPANRWRIDVTATGACPVLTWPSVSGSQYSIEKSTNLQTGFSVLAPSIPATPPDNTYTDTLAAATGPYFYRAVRDNGSGTPIRTANVAGCARITIRSNAYNMISAGYQKAAVYSGMIDSNTTSILYDDRAEWNTDQYARGVSGQEEVGTSTFYLEITSGPFEGRHFYLLSNGATTLVIDGGLPADIEPDDLANATYRIVPALRIRDLFGEVADTPLQGDIWGVQSPDEVKFWDTTSGWGDRIYYVEGGFLQGILGGRWRQLWADANDNVIDRDAGILVRSLSDTDIVLPVSGDVSDHTQAIVLSTNYTFIGGWPDDVCIGSTTLSNLLDGSVFAPNADTVLEWTTDNGWMDDVYFMSPLGAWMRGGAQVNTTFQLEAGGAYFVRIKNSTTNRVWKKNSALP